MTGLSMNGSGHARRFKWYERCVCILLEQNQAFVATRGFARQKRSGRWGDRSA